MYLLPYLVVLPCARCRSLASVDIDGAPAKVVVWIRKDATCFLYGTLVYHECDHPAWQWNFLPVAVHDRELLWCKAVGEDEVHEGVYLDLFSCHAAALEAVG